MDNYYTENQPRDTPFPQIAKTCTNAAIYKNTIKNNNFRNKLNPGFLHNKNIKHQSQYIEKPKKLHDRIEHQIEKNEINIRRGMPSPNSNTKNRRMLGLTKQCTLDSQGRMSTGSSKRSPFKAYESETMKHNMVYMQNNSLASANNVMQTENPNERFQRSNERRLLTDPNEVNCQEAEVKDLAWKKVYNQSKMKNRASQFIKNNKDKIEKFDINFVISDSMKDVSTTNSKFYTEIDTTIKFDYKDFNIYDDIGNKLNAFINSDHDTYFDRHLKHKDTTTRKNELEKLIDILIQQKEHT